VVGLIVRPPVFSGRGQDQPVRPDDGTGIKGGREDKTTCLPLDHHWSVTLHMTHK